MARRDRGKKNDICSVDINEICKALLDDVCRRCLLDAVDEEVLEEFERVLDHRIYA